MEFVGNVQLVGGNSDSADAILKMLESGGITVRRNPDVYRREYKSFGVDEARELTQMASARAVASDRRIFVIVTASMTTEAQNALLKTLEEPAGNALFFFVVPSTHMLLPTLRSRAQTISFSSSDQKESLIDVATFLQANPQKRLDMLKPLFEKDDDDERDLGQIIAFLSSLERTLAANSKKNHDALASVYRARKYLGDKGSLAKALLEQVALLI